MTEESSVCTRNRCCDRDAFVTVGDVDCLRCAEPCGKGSIDASSVVPPGLRVAVCSWGRCQVRCRVVLREPAAGVPGARTKAFRARVWVKQDTDTDAETETFYSRIRVEMIR